MTKVFRRALAAAVPSLFVFAYAHSVLADKGHLHGVNVGKPGDTAAVSRTIEVVMRDNYYEPDHISVKAGETIRFIISNKGEFVHEFSIGTAAMHAAHHAEMQMMVEHGVLKADRIDWQAAKAMQASMGHGMHNDPNSVLLEPGRSVELVWVFPDGAELEFACNVPGHYDAGMQGIIQLSR